MTTVPLSRGFYKLVNEAYSEDKEYVRHLDETIAECYNPADFYNSSSVEANLDNSGFG